MSKKITIFKEVYDYYYDGELTKEQFADLMLLHYQVMWGNGVEVNDIQDKEVRMIWRTLQHTVKKSAKNAKDYDKRKENAENENKADLSPSNESDDNLYQPEDENQNTGLKTAKNEVIENIETTEQIIDDDNMGNLTNIRLNPTTGMYEYTKEQKEQIKEKVIEKNTPKPVNVLVQTTPNVEMTFSQFLKEEGYNIKTIIDDLNEGGMRANVQAKENLRRLFNTQYGRIYKEQITEIINRNIVKTA